MALCSYHSHHCDNFQYSSILDERTQFHWIFRGSLWHVGFYLGKAKISGLGKKTAERIILELKDKLGVAAAWEAASAMHAPTPEQEQANEAVLALIALGYKQIDAHKAVRELQEKSEPKSAEDAWARTLAWFNEHLT